MRVLKSLLLVIVLALALSVGAGAAVPPGTPGEAKCMAIMDARTVANFQKLLNDGGHEYLTVLSGEAFATAAEVRQRSYLAVLRCVDHSGVVYCVHVLVVRGVPITICARETGERILDS